MHRSGPLALSVFAFVATLAGPLPAQAIRAAEPAPNVVLADAPAAPLAITKDDRILGRPDAPITIVEYASMSCPHCAHFATTVLPELKKKWIDTGKAKLVLRDFPLDKLALRAAMIQRCASPDRFYAFVETLFADQQQWVMAEDAEAALARLAQLGGISRSAFDACLKDSALENFILQERLVAAKDLGVNATPTFFINGNKFSGEPTLAEFDKVLSGLAAKS
jgi:protein-disulfide isomerase